MPESIAIIFYCTACLILGFALGFDAGILIPTNRTLKSNDE